MRLALCLLCALLFAVPAQAQTPQQPPTFQPPQPSQTTIQSQQLLSCYLNCDTRAGQCQGTCTQSNSAQVTLVPVTPSTTTRPDPGALSQCFLSCSSQQLVCKQACAIH